MTSEQCVSTFTPELFLLLVVLRPTNMADGPCVSLAGECPLDPGGYFIVRVRGLSPSCLTSMSPFQCAQDESAIKTAVAKAILTPQWGSYIDELPGAGHGEGHSVPGTAVQEPYHHRYGQQRRADGDGHQHDARPQEQDKPHRQKWPLLPQAQRLRVSGLRQVAAKFPFAPLPMRSTCRVNIRPLPIRALYA